ncbi:hypothetical protein LGK97_18775 [Clostridium sp. CS001]|uniref:hypothetical protein n=1 Tax=Clostridium sp. CS001 TaxID=2880648 RepID=UPI001CF34085|nr:hypothetical protein [Clostridium sp. CS001]MCB2291759.1 hypothetical protein [Clostridium sp. CS001]
MKVINSSKKNSIICYSVSALIFLAIGLMGIYLSPGDEMGYVMLNFYIIMPLTSLISSFILSIKKDYLFWSYPIFVGILGIIVPFTVFRTFATMDLFFALFPAVIGLIIGLMVRATIANKH